MKFHPFKPNIQKTTKKLLIGTLPPERVKFYFSSSKNTRLWDILKTIGTKENMVCKGSNDLSTSHITIQKIGPRLQIKVLLARVLGIVDVSIGRMSKTVADST